MPLLASIPLVGPLLDAAVRALVGPTVASARGLEPVASHAVETSPEKRPRTLKHLLRGNHANHALLYGPHNSRHNHMAHALCSAYLLGATPEQLNRIYDAVAPQLVPWQNSPAEIADVDWRDYLGDPAYQRAYVDFFEDVLAEHSIGYSWRTVVETYLLGQGRRQRGDDDDDNVMVEGDQVQQIFSSRVHPAKNREHNRGNGDENDDENDDDDNDADNHPLLHSLISGLGHPLIHLAYAFEMDSRVLAMEALGMSAVTYNPAFAKKFSLDKDSSPRQVPSSLHGLSLQALVDRVAQDQRFAAVAPGRMSAESVLLAAPSADVETALLEYWHAWDLSGGADKNLLPRMREAQDVAVAMLVASVKPGTHSYNFFVCHVLTTSHAVRVLLPEIPPALHAVFLRQWWLLTLAVYVSIGRPAVDPDNVPTDRKGKGWAYVEQQAVSSRWSTDAYYTQTIRSIKEATRTWGDVRDCYLNAVVWFVDDFAGWVR
ncbi:hypothetical protein SEPCBS119000_004527 [Sporothrix epigloea]|uniref:Oxidoreductase AflY n=1 Tax=Sporothrix epigloea TaxID=1892477 RepID=A0ABP0DUE9_9PEZI